MLEKEEGESAVKVDANFQPAKPKRSKPRQVLAGLAGKERGTKRWGGRVWPR